MFVPTGTFSIGVEWWRGMSKKEQVNHEKNGSWFWYFVSVRIVAGCVCFAVFGGYGQLA